MLVSGVQQSDSVIHKLLSLLFQILFSFRLLQNIEQSSLCYTVGPCWLSILNIVVCTCHSQIPNLSLPRPPFRTFNEGQLLLLSLHFKDKAYLVMVYCYFKYTARFHLPTFYLDVFASMIINVRLI